MHNLNHASDQYTSVLDKFNRFFSTICKIAYANWINVQLRANPMRHWTPNTIDSTPATVRNVAILKFKKKFWSHNQVTKASITEHWTLNTESSVNCCYWNEILNMIDQTNHTTDCVWIFVVSFQCQHRLRNTILLFIVCASAIVERCCYSNNIPKFIYFQRLYIGVDEQQQNAYWMYCVHSVPQQC